jgi:glucose-1-phosphate adenylyltransferase
MPCIAASILQTVLGIILGGGAGSRLYPLTKKRAKPAVPLGANYRLIDIPVSNCINSGAGKATGPTLPAHTFSHV